MKSLLFALIILLSISITNQATADDKPLQGQAKIDSLLAELPNAKGDTNEVKLLYNLSFYFNSINPDMGIVYGMNGLKLSKNIDWRKGQAQCYNSLGINYKAQSNNLKALDYFKKALTINEELSNKNGIATVLGNIGNVYFNLTDYPKALEYFGKALKIDEELGDKNGVARQLGSIGNVYLYLSDYPKTLEYYQQSLKTYEELGDKNGVAINLANTGNIYLYWSKYPKALEYFGKSLKVYEELRDKNGLANNLGSIGIIYYYQSNYPKALEYYGKALKVNEELGNKVGLANNLGNMGLVYDVQSNYLKALEYYGNALKIYKKIGDKNGLANNLGNMGQLYLSISQDSVSIKPNELNEFVSLNKSINLNKSIEYSLEAIKIYEEIGELNSKRLSVKSLADAYKLKGDYLNWGEALEEHHKLKDSIFNQENSDKLDALEKAREDDVNRIKIEKQQVQLAAQENEKMFIIYSGIGIIAFVIAILILIAYQRKKSDKLLYNVLPISIAKRLKKKEHPISDHFDQASIIFIDIVGFTAMSKNSDPTDIVKALNKVFTHYDSIASKHGLEKIKTIGDCYMAAAGIPVIQTDNTLRAARMAIEVRDYMVDYYTDHGFKLDVRIGLDCGPVVAGVIGEKKFIYDMWSDAVNTASRMESTGQSGSVHISERFKEAVAEFDEFEFIDRGEMEIKGKGKMRTYFIEERKAEVV